MSRNQQLIARTARWTRWLVTLLLGAALLLQLAVLFPGLTHIRLHAYADTNVARVINGLHSVFMIVALVQLILLLRNLEQGDLFSAGVTRRLRAFALFTLLAVATGGLLAPAIAFLFPQCGPDGPCVRRFPVDMRGLWSLVTSVIFFLVARLLDEARRIDEDNRQII